MKSRFIAAASIALASLLAEAGVVAHYPMEVRSGQIVETVSGDRFAVEGHFSPENVAGAVGQALRFDGYTSHIDARIGAVLPKGCKSMTVSMWVAVPSYPIIEIDVDTKEQTPIATCIDEGAKSGFGFYLGFNGAWSFRTYVGGWPVNIEINTPFPTYQWNNMVAVIDGAAKQARVYNNGKLVGQSRCQGEPSLAAAPFLMGQGNASRMAGPFELMSFNGLIDDIKVWDEALDESVIKSWKAENIANLDIPASRFAKELLRPRFHGMPAAGWTNECHGMAYADGRYHLFFQKNANGPYMARLHWGHISSENLYEWREEKIALAPGASYDIKGCWSGCVFSDTQITGGRPNILYTAVDYGRASIAQAMPDGNDLLNWTKSSRNPIIPGRPDGLSDDFRDPYFFRNGDEAYIIVGSSKNGVGTTTLHRYDVASQSWSNNGDLFFTGNSASQAGTFWEMPNVTPMGEGQWLFTATPLNTSIGVRTLYWTGSIASNGTFQPTSGFYIPKGVELISRHGFGMLSPTVFQHDGRTIALGIVPDKLPSEDNWNLGWAHCYSLPRQWWLNEQGELQQKPCEELAGLRMGGGFSKDAFELSGTQELASVAGRAVELLGVFEVGSTSVGFNIFKNASGCGSITYNPSTGELIVDFRTLKRLVNDGGVYDGLYRASLPEFLRRGSELKLNVFVDHSIIDIFINDRWASSIRVFPTDSDADGVEVFADGGTAKVKSLQAWNLSASESGGLEEVSADKAVVASSMNVYTSSGVLVRADADSDAPLEGLPQGIYIVGGMKMIVR